MSSPSDTGAGGCATHRGGLTASAIYANAELGKASFHLDPSDVDEVAARVECDPSAITFSVGATGAEASSGTLLEFTPDEATALAHQLLRAADDFRDDEREER